MDIFLKVLGWFIVFISVQFLIAAIKMTSQITSGRIRGPAIQGAWIGTILAWIGFAAVLALGLWLALFR